MTVTVGPSNLYRNPARLLNRLGLAAATVATALAKAIAEQSYWRQPSPS